MGAACYYLGQHTAVCQVGAAEVASSRGAFVFAEVFWYNAQSNWCLLYCQARLIYLLVVTELCGCCRVGHT